MKNVKASKHTKEDDEERDIYSSEYIEELGEDDELSLAEQGFMEGYIEA